MELGRDYFDRLDTETRASLKVQRSEFLGIGFPVTGDDAFQEALERIRRESFDATHHCWAYRLLDGASIIARSADDGEPTGTAGRPILQAIEDADLLDSAVVVVRWYGGVKLGTGGLARAYRDAARESLSSSTRRRVHLYRRLRCRPGFERMNLVYRLIDPPNVVLAAERFDPEPLFDLDVRRSMADALKRDLEEMRIVIERVKGEE